MSLHPDYSGKKSGGREGVRLLVAFMLEKLELSAGLMDHLASRKLFLQKINLIFSIPHLGSCNRVD